MQISIRTLVLFGLYILDVIAIAAVARPGQNALSSPGSAQVNAKQTLKFPSCKRLVKGKSSSLGPTRKKGEKQPRSHQRDFNSIVSQIESTPSSIHVEKVELQPLGEHTIESRRPRPKEVIQYDWGKITSSSNPDGMAMDVCGCTAVFVWTNDGALYGAHVVDKDMKPITAMASDIASKRLYVVAVKIETPDIEENDSEDAKKALLEADINEHPVVDKYEYSAYGGYRFVAKAGQGNAGRTQKRE